MIPPVNKCWKFNFQSNSQPKQALWFQNETPPAIAEMLSKAGRFSQVVHILVLEAA